MNVVVRMFEQGGYEAVSIESTAQVLAISRATLYRAVPSKDDLVANVLDQTARELSRDVAAILKSRGLTGEERLDQLLRLQLDFAMRRPRCLVAIFWGADLPADVFQRLQAWRDEHERAWLRVYSVSRQDIPSAGRRPLRGGLAHRRSHRRGGFPAVRIRRRESAAVD